MSFSSIATFGLLAASALASPLDVSAAGVSLPGLPAHCMTSYKGIAFGYLPDDERADKVNMASLAALSGKKGCFFGDYSHVKGSSYDGKDITGKGKLADGAVVVPSIMPDGVTWKQVDAALAGRIANVAKSFTSQGLTVYLRFAHEMNWYAKPGRADPVYPGGMKYDEYKAAWVNVAKECHKIKNCFMMWSPNGNDLDQLGNWWPGAEYVDIVSLDSYPKDRATIDRGFGGSFGKVHDDFAKKYNKPFLIGETAFTGSEAEKTEWIKKLTTSDDLSKYPNYKGAMWFEYNKKENNKQNNFYVIYGHNKKEIDGVVANFQ
ncbi:glycoside hydrolase [Apiospora kogelbergensis]|uniref:Glycoside hydrolase n=1 Tax=Apiospora kogelbergensis TaxID=1337665 RepID=A0AAW0R7I2_9PEZI